MSIFVTSDSHFNHVNMCGPKISKWDSGYRNFDSLVEMNDTIINNINSVVDANDILYHLGDFAFGNKKEIPIHRARINCKTIHFLYGNHDAAIQRTYPYYQELFASVGYYTELRVAKTLVTMFHYPIGSWNEIGSGAIQLHGHCHDSYSRTIGRQMDVGVDSHDMKPLLLDEVVEDMLQIKPVTVDHHRKDTNYH